ncbi:MAG: DUF1236 domain-containing protein [Methylobacterium mesophilicum]|nr:DUF1236 domain-containing protein [Methylobacterium mesophilicum]
MKSRFAAAAAGLFILSATGAALAQEIVIQPEQEVIVREYVRQRPVTSVTVPDFAFESGTVVPEEVELYPIDDMPDASYRYVVIDDRTVLVEPQTRRVIRVLE